MNSDVWDRIGVAVCSGEAWGSSHDTDIGSTDASSDAVDWLAIEAETGCAGFWSEDGILLSLSFDVVLELDDS